MEVKAKTYEEAAMECVANLSDEDIEYFHLHIGYIHHHFGYGLYLRNHYLYLLDKDSLGVLGDIHRDSLGKNIYHLMIPIMFPEYKGHEKYISRITDTPFDDLNANYYLKFGKNFISDISPEKFFHLPECSFVENSGFDSWWNEYRSENYNYALAIAEHIWEYDVFRQTAMELGYTNSEIEEVHHLCIELLKEKYLFVPLEILFAKNESSESKKALMKYPEMIKWLFSKHESKVQLLPDYLSKNRDIVKTMLSAIDSF